MPDVKEVIKGLKKMLEESKYNDSVQYNPWADTETLEDALALLKAQEPVEPFMEHSVHTGSKLICCGACEKPICMTKDSYRPKYCPECGREVKWT